MLRCTVSSEEEKDGNIDKIFHGLNVNKRLCLIHEFCFKPLPLGQREGIESVRNQS